LESKVLNINHINEGDVNALARSYNVLDHHNNFKKALTSLIPRCDLNGYTKYELHSLINAILTKKYKGEGMLKAKLVELFVNKNVTAAFEIRVNNSRVDFLKVNGDTVSYEIKSGIDNLTKLSKQVSDYEKVFEFNYIVIDERHYTAALKLIPNPYGIYVLRNNKLIEDKKASLNTNLDSLIQLSLFTKKELQQSFKGIPADFNCIQEIYSKEEINAVFKQMLKKRYLKKWNFLKSNLNDILPIDYQYFFHHNVNPSIIYSY